MGFELRVKKGTYGRSAPIKSAVIIKVSLELSPLPLVFGLKESCEQRSLSFSQSSSRPPSLWILMLLELLSLFDTDGVNFGNSSKHRKKVK